MPFDLSTLHKKKQVFETLLKKELIREIGFIADVRSGRAQPREMVGQRLARSVTMLIPKLAGDFSGVTAEIGVF